MDISVLTSWQWALGAVAAVVVGLAKTGVPGIGILAVPLMALVFPGRQSVGALLPMLIVADLFAVAFYRRHARWDRLWGLLPWVMVGLVGGFVFLIAFRGDPAWFQRILGGLVLAMLGLQLLRHRYGDRLVPRDTLTTSATGAGAGFATCVGNAAGPIMTLYLHAKGLPKRQFMGTNAWFFMLVNWSKIPLFLLVGWLVPARPMIDGDSLLYNAIMVPPIVLGALSGAWLLSRIPQRIFSAAVLLFAALAALKLLLS